MSSTTVIEPVVKTISLNADVEKAFRHFTENMHVWWPLATHSLSQENAKTVVFEAKEGGRIYEIDGSGKEREWGRVKVCEPPHRIVFSWVLEDPVNQTEVEVQFRDEGGGKSSLTLTHRGWENRSDGAKWRGEYDKGWDGVLAAYAGGLN